MSTTIRVPASGQIALAGAGGIQAAGLTQLQLEGLLRAELLKRGAARNLQLRVFLREYRSEPVAVLGAVRLPNLYYLEAPETLLEVLAMAGGMADKVLAKSVIVRRKARAAEAVSRTGEKQAGQQIIKIPVSALLQTGDPRFNVYVQPGDVVRVVPASRYYVAGAVKRPGAYFLADSGRISVRRALTLAGGMAADARASHALIIRLQPGLPRSEQRVDLSHVSAIRGEEISLSPDDVLFVPGNTPKEDALRGIETGRNAGANFPIAGTAWAAPHNAKRR